MPETDCGDEYYCNKKNCEVAQLLRGQAQVGVLTKEGWDALVQRSKNDPYCVDKRQIGEAAKVKPTLRSNP